MDFKSLVWVKLNHRVVGRYLGSPEMQKFIYDRAKVVEDELESSFEGRVSRNRLSGTPIVYFNKLANREVERRTRTKGRDGRARVDVEVTEMTGDDFRSQEFQKAVLRSAGK